MENVCISPEYRRVNGKMKLTGLNIDCLENILEYLDFGDILTAANSNNRLNKAANYIFVRKYCQKVIFDNIVLIPQDQFHINNEFIKFFDFKTSLQFIRCFGHLVFDINLVQNEPKLDQHIIKYLNEFCFKSLIRISIDYGFIGWDHLG